MAEIRRQISDNKTLITRSLLPGVCHLPAGIFLKQEILKNILLFFKHNMFYFVADIPGSVANGVSLITQSLTIKFSTWHSINTTRRQ
jgi:hypothetical protein